MTKILALYLPQFHSIKENDEWWGEGFTEWNVVKSASVINKHTKQPKVPQQGYYDLSEKESIKNQASLANQYGIDGFIIYNYYSNGDKLLEKPSEIILANKDINIEYCFSWANHDWMRTWFSYNREMLRKQEYANTDQEIYDHFNYLVDFFKDNRYIKIDNKPVFIIYNYDDIPNFKRYLEIWNESAILEGFSGVYFIQTLGGKNLEWNKKYFDSCFDFEPTFTTFSEMKIVHSIHRIKRFIKRKFNLQLMTNFFNYDTVCRLMENRVYSDKEHCYGMFGEWDNTPRHKDNGTLFINFNIKRFEKCFEIQYKKSVENNHPFLVFDAWNEWGEGAILEPDNFYGTKKLEVIKKIKKQYEK
ncbi:glycosyl transferase [Streptococcus uberis Ab71]|uniref:glycosyltransferase WbsX family protein n=1 Tax=Streptococcus uberis TaxID=1349 RepID=UPI0006202B32|nr:glycoside hydrolase family 99-like domain-containing protein [Streptococcus uberis]KKF42062.1 glycosyl transferase [Streptococcus uberis Ab71]